MFHRLVGTAVLMTLVAAIPARAQERFSFFVPSTPESVERMLELADLRDDDVVVDLGSGNGLIPLTAARMNSRLRGWGVDVDAKLVDESNALARSEGLGDRVRFYHRNAFDADLGDATVVTMWLFPELMRLLRPVILERARPGTRVLTSTWDIGSWEPDEVRRDGTNVYMWIVPAKVAGGWQWNLTFNGRRVPYSIVLEQQFQKIEGVARAGTRREVLESATLRGTGITFELAITIDGLGLTRHSFTGTVRGDAIEGTVTVTPSNGAASTQTWRARRTSRPSYFRDTGTAMFEKTAEP
jgi:hypothetical protein